MKEKQRVVEGDTFSLHLDDAGRFGELRFGETTVGPPVVSTVYTLNDQESDVQPLSQEEASFRLTSGELSGALSIASGNEVSFHLEPDQKDVIKRVGLSIFFPLDTIFHLAESRSTGRRLDSDMPIGESYRTDLSYNFLLANTQGRWIRFRADHEWFRAAKVEIARHSEMFAVTFSWAVESDCFLAVFASMAEALEDLQDWLEGEFGIRKLRDRRRNTPGWVHNVRLVLTVDMLRSNWEITHDYRDVLELARELKDIGCPPDTLFYIPGWQGAYDSSHPTYRPRPELGGEGAFSDMVDGLHDCGFRVMIHTTGWGIDPYHPDIDNLDRLVLKDENGDYYKAWQTGPKYQPAKRSLGFRTGQVPLKVEKGFRSFAFQTGVIPGRCEALFTLGNVDVGDSRIRMRVGRRNVLSPSGWFADHTHYDYPFPLLLEAGENTIQVDVVGDAEPNWEESWYRIRYSFGPATPYSSWTWPILMADASHPEYIKIFTENVSEVVKEFGIDAVHVDATWFDRPDLTSPARDLFLRLQELLPRTAICSEAVLAFEEMGYFVFSQGATQNLIDARRAPREQGSVFARGGRSELYSWLNKESPICRFAKDYYYTYPHLCAANAFVPVGKVCNTYPPRKMPKTSAELWKILRGFPRLDYVPGLRVNYRKYGLDDEARQFITELASKTDLR